MLASILTPASDFMDDAACVGTDPELFFSPNRADQRKAKSICLGCPVRAECKTWGNDSEYGIFGGEVASNRDSAVSEAKHDARAERDALVMGLKAEGLSNVEVARRTGVPAATVAYIINRTTAA